MCLEKNKKKTKKTKTDMLEDSQFPLCFQLWLYLPFSSPTHTFFFFYFLHYITYPWTLTNQQTTRLAKTQLWGITTLTVIRQDGTKNPEPKTWKPEQSLTASFVAIKDKIATFAKPQKYIFPSPPYPVKVQLWFNCCPSTEESF